MPKYLITTISSFRHTYIVDAPSEHEAEEFIMRDRNGKFPIEADQHFLGESATAIEEGDEAVQEYLEFMGKFNRGNYWLTEEQLTNKYEPQETPPEE